MKRILLTLVVLPGALTAADRNSSALSTNIHQLISSRAAGLTEATMVAYTNTIPGTNITYGMVPIRGGEFLLGSPGSEPGRASDEGPQRRVRIEPFWMGICEVTWNEYEMFLRGRMRRGNCAAPRASFPCPNGKKPTPPFPEVPGTWSKLTLSASASCVLSASQRQKKPTGPGTTGSKLIKGPRKRWMGQSNWGQLSTLTPRLRSG